MLASILPRTTARVSESGAHGLTHSAPARRRLVTVGLQCKDSDLLVAFKAPAELPRVSVRCDVLLKKRIVRDGWEKSYQ